MSDSVRPHRRKPTRLPRPWDSPGKNTGVDCHFLLQCMKVKSQSEVTQSCLTLSNPMDCSPRDILNHPKPNPGILRDRILPPTWLSGFSSVQSLSCVRLFVTPWTAAHQAPLSITNSLSLLKFISIPSVMPSNHLILCHPLLFLPSIFPSIRLLLQWVSSSNQVVKLGASASASVLLMNIQDWFP